MKIQLKIKELTGKLMILTKIMFWVFKEQKFTLFNKNYEIALEISVHFSALNVQNVI